jgi:putative hydrolase of the HAD superfamily
MLTSPGVTTLFLDIGGVLLNNGWDRQMGRRAAQDFMLDYEGLNERHLLAFGSYESGLLDLEGYLERVVSHEERTFTREEFKTFMFDQSQPHPEMLTLIRRLKARYHLKTVAVSNEGRELNTHRIHKFALAEVIDFFVSSCYVYIHKPDPDIFLMALDMAQVAPQQVVYCEDREMFVAVASGLGIRGVLHSSYESMRSALTGLGFPLD